MTRIKGLGICLIVVAMFGVSATAMAEVEEGDMDVGFFGGVLLGDTLLDTEVHMNQRWKYETNEAALFGAFFRYTVCRRAALQASLFYAQPELEARQTYFNISQKFKYDLTIWSVALDGLIYINPGYKDVVYFIVGVGLLAWDIEYESGGQSDDGTDPVFSVGVGAKFGITENLSIIGEGRDYIWKIEPEDSGTDDWDRTNNFAFSVGLQYTF